MGDPTKLPSTGFDTSSLAGLLGAPGGTAPTFSTQGSSQDDPVRQLIAKILQSAQQGSKQLAQPVPAPLPQQTPHPDPTPPGAYKSEWGFERFAANLQNSIQAGVAQHKATQLAKAESDWNALATAMQSGNQQALNAILTDPKKLKLMAKALNQDWLNPEKTDVYKEGLKNVLAQQQQKGQAAQGMMAMFKHLIGRATQPQLTDEQKQRMASEIRAKAPMTQAQPLNKESTALLLEELKEAEKGREIEAKERLEQQKQEYQTNRDTFKAAHQESLKKMELSQQQAIESMRERAREAHDDKMIAAQFKALGMKEAERYKITPAEVNKSMNSTVSSLNNEYSKAKAEVGKLQDRITKFEGMIQSKGWTKFYKDDPDIAQAQSDLKEAQENAARLKAASDYIAKNRQKVLKDPDSMEDVISKATAISQGSDLSDLGGTQEK